MVKTSTLELLEGSTTRVATSDVTLIEGSIIRGVMLGVKSMVGSIGSSMYMNQYELFQKNGYVYVKIRFKCYNLNYVFEILDYIIQTALLRVESIDDCVVL